MSPDAERRPLRFAGTATYPQGLVVGLDVGSTTVKYVVVDPARQDTLVQDYQRHGSRPHERCFAMLTAMLSRFPEVPHHAIRVFVTGSGGAAIGALIGARFVQEVHATSLAARTRFPDVQSLIELGGQDAKIVVFETDPITGRIHTMPSMNDKCAGGTGAVIDKVIAKLGLCATDLRRMGDAGPMRHPVAGKCGVFAETDIIGLQKQGVPPSELLASLFASLVQQNLAVLARGHTLRPRVLLLGGPNCFLPGLQDCWRQTLRALWDERGVAYDTTVPLEELVVVPPDAQYFAAMGAVLCAAHECVHTPDVGRFQGIGALARYLQGERTPGRRALPGRGLWTTPDDLAAFLARYTPVAWAPPTFGAGDVVRAFLGVDGGSTSTKAVLLDEAAHVLATSYRLSAGSPIQDAIDVIDDLRRGVEGQGATLEILGVGTTGYAKDLLRDVLQADVALVETVAHTQAGLLFYPDTDVIVDVGGQDIKLMMLAHGQATDFKVNTQCSAGNGHFLQSTAHALGYPVEALADVAFSATAMPEFGSGCAVFLQSDIVDFQRQGWTPPEILAALCHVLPRNIWLYVAQIPHLPRLGRRFLLQGGTQHNLAAVKAQVDFITSRFTGDTPPPEVVVHPFCGEAGAIGAAVDARRQYLADGHRTTFIGLDRVPMVAFRSTRSEATRCHFCKNACLRTFIDVQTGAADPAPLAVSPATPLVALRRASPVARRPGEHRLILATCDKGTVEDVTAMTAIKRGLDAHIAAYPDFAALSARAAFAPAGVPLVADDPMRRAGWDLLRRRRASPAAAARTRRATLRIGMPRVLGMYSMGPWFMAWFESLGVRARHLVWSDPTSDTLYRAGATRGAIDPCYPSKVAIPHVHNLLSAKHSAAHPLDIIFFPMIDSLPTFLEGVVDSRACPAATMTPAAVKAAFTMERDLFADHGIRFLDTFLNAAEPALMARQMFQAFEDLLGLSVEENARACRAAWTHLATVAARLRTQARVVLDQLEATDRVGIVLLSRPYHGDAGINHDIPAAFQQMGVPIFTPDTLPHDPDLLARLFGPVGVGGDPARSIADLWTHTYNENSNRKLWAAKFAARHPNLVALELSSFKCGHDAPIYAAVEQAVAASGTPYFAFKDIDENRPVGALRLRVETIAYFLRQYRIPRVAPCGDVAPPGTAGARCG